MVSLLKSFDTYHTAYLTKLRLEIKSLNLLTSKIVSEIENQKNNTVLKESPNASRLVITDSSPITILEDTYNDFKKYLVALIQYFDSKEELHCHFALSSSIDGPKFCQLPSLCNMLWRRIEIVSKISHDKSTICTPTPYKESERVTMSFESTQTELSSLLYCESCFLSTELIKSLVYFILDAQKKHNVVESNVSKTRERVRNEVFDMSQWGVMKEWTTSILKDMEWILSFTVSLVKKCNLLNQEQDTMREEHYKVKTNLQNNLDLTRKQLEAEEKFKLFNESLMLIKDDCIQIKKSQKALGLFLKHNMISQSRNISDLKDDIDFVIKKTENYFTEALLKEVVKLKACQINLEKKENLLSDLKTNISELRSEKQQLKEKLRILINQKETQEDEIRKIRGKVMELEKLLEEIQAREEHKEPHTKTAANKNLKVSGDPLTDMENQRQINKQNIKALMKENAHLKTTISKLKKIKTEPFESRSLKTN